MFSMTTSLEAPRLSTTSLDGSADTEAEAVSVFGELEEVGEERRVNRRAAAGGGPVEAPSSGFGNREWQESAGERLDSENRA